MRDTERDEGRGMRDETVLDLPHPSSLIPHPSSLEFATVALVGMGLMGGSLGLAMRERRLARRVVAVARRPETVRRAVELGAADEGCSEPREGVAAADLVILCTPVLTMPAMVERIAPHLKPGAVVTDVGSTKAVLVRELPPRLRPETPYVGGHPMAGSE